MDDIFEYDEVLLQGIVNRPEDERWLCAAKLTLVTDIELERVHTLCMPKMCYKDFIIAFYERFEMLPEWVRRCRIVLKPNYQELTGEMFYFSRQPAPIYKLDERLKSFELK